MKKHLTLFAVLTLLLTGCGEEKIPYTSAGPSASDAPEVSALPSANPSQTPSESPKPSETPSETPSVSESPSPSTPTVSLWGKDRDEERKQYLGGYVLPYINLGANKRITSDFRNSFYKNSSYYEIFGDSDFDGSRLGAEFKPAFEADGFTVTVNSENTVLTATKDSAHLKVVIEQSDSTFVLKAYYDEPFDATKKTAWTADEETEIKASLSDHLLPFVYLGSNNPYRYTNRDGKTFRIFGWEWDDSILTSALAAYKSEDGWNASITDENGSKTFTATQTFTDCTITITIEQSEKSSNNRAVLQAYKEEIWNPSLAATDWEDDIKDEIHADFDNHDIPYVYLGTQSPSVSLNSIGNRLDFKGGYWNDEVIDLAESAFTAAGWTVAQYQGTSGKAINATILEDDGCRLNRVIECPYNPSSGKIDRYVSYDESLTIPADATGWDEDTLSARNTYFNGHTLPYFYIGAKDTRASFSYSTASRIINPVLSGTYNTQRLYEAEKALANDGYTLAKSYLSTYGTFNLSAMKTFDDGDSFIVTRKAVNQTTASLKGTASVSIQYLEKYNPADVISWDKGTDTKDAALTTAKSRTDGFGADHSVPFIYLGAQHFYSAYDTANRSRTIYGGRWDDDILVQAKATLANDNENGTWGSATETKDSSGLVTYTVKKTYTDGGVRTLAIKQPAADTASNPFHQTTRTLTFNEAYGTTETEWTDTGTATSTKVLTNRKAALNDYTIPYIYLHAENASLTSTKSVGSNGTYSYTTIKGGIWDDRILTDAIPVLEADGYTVNTNRIRNQHISLEGIKKNADGSYLRVLLYKDGATTTSKAVLVAFYDAPKTLPASTAADWTDEDKAIYEGKLYNSVPYFYIGDYYTVKRTEDPTKAKSYVTFQTNTSKLADGYHYLYNNLAYVLNAKNAFDAAGWTTEMDWFNSVTNGGSGYTSFIAEIKNANGSTTRAQVVASSNSLKLTVYSYEPYQLPTEEKTWGTDSETIRENNFYGNIAPYVYLGADNVYWTSNSASSHKVVRQGGIWNDQVLEDVKNTLSKDTSATWSFRYSHETYNSSETVKTLLASGEITNADGTKSYWEYRIYPAKVGFTKTINCEIFYYK